MTESDFIKAIAAAENGAGRAVALLMFADWCFDHSEPWKEEAARWAAKWERLPSDMSQMVTHACWGWSYYARQLIINDSDYIDWSDVPKIVFDMMMFSPSSERINNLWIALPSRSGAWSILFATWDAAARTNRKQLLIDMRDAEPSEVAMSDRAAFIRAIRANPDDYAAPLLYADWLD